MNCPTFREQFKTEVFLLPAKNSPGIKKKRPDFIRTLFLFCFKRAQLSTFAAGFLNLFAFMTNGSLSCSQTSYRYTER